MDLDISRLPEPLRSRAEEMVRMPPLVRVSRFLRGHVSDADSLDEIRTGLRRVAAHTTQWLKLDLRDLNALLTQPQEPGLLSRLVTFDCNRVLEDRSDDAAREFLRPIADMLRDVITEADQERAQRLRQLGGGGHG